MSSTKIMTPIQKVAILGASGNFGTPITSALTRNACFEVTIITRPESTSVFPPGIPVIRTAYTLEDLTKAMAGQDAIVCAVSPAAVTLQSVIIDAAEAASVKRFIVNDFGWGPRTRTHGLPEFSESVEKRHVGWDYAAKRAAANSAFTWTGITSGNPIDWALRKFPTMGFNAVSQTATIYDAGTEMFTGTTLEGIGNSVVGVFSHPDETANRFVNVLSIKTCQNELLQAFEKVTGKEWPVQHSTAETLRTEGRARKDVGASWTLHIAVVQLVDPGKARNVVALSYKESDSELLGVSEETPESIAERVMNFEIR